jgi:ABC-type Fe3+-hydroxamate transport system substrate-binding protein
MHKMHTVVIIATLVVASACSSSSDDSSASSSDAVAGATDSTNPEFTEEERGPGSVAPTSVSTNSIALPVTTDGVAPTSAAEEDDLNDDLLPLDDVDDAPACQSFARFFNGFADVAFAAAFLESDDESSSGGEPATIEQIEVVRYLNLIENVPVLRAELPDVMLDVFGPIFDRVEAAPQLMTDAGFSQDELDQLVADLDADVTSSDPETDPRIVAAADELIAEFGTFDSIVTGLDTVGSAAEDEGNVWLADNCPKLSELTGS